MPTEAGLPGACHNIAMAGGWRNRRWLLRWEDFLLSLYSNSFLRSQRVTGSGMQMSLRGHHPGPFRPRLWVGEFLVSAKEVSTPGLAGLAGEGMGSREHGRIITCLALAM